MSNGAGSTFATNLVPAMDSYLALVLLLFVLASIDLVVGVSNDAVNFLNSAIGSKVANIRTILIIASVGILVGTVFSSGMMEVARKGIFNPGFFSFEHIMTLFLTVMLTDILLLDLYNSLGLPTSTTVSIVFELLGAAFMTGWLVSLSSDNGPVIFEEFLNFSSAFKIISGIFLSVIISFTVGMIVQYFARLLFSFNIERSMKRYGAVFGGLAITLITYFLLIKGAKGSSLVTEGMLNWIKSNTALLLLISFVTWTIVTQLMMTVFKMNPLRVIVLLGTFSLAMAFAGNDLVNFIGVAVAGMQAYGSWSVSGVGASEFYMTALEQKVHTPTLLLLGAGVIMVITLWLSSKARKVTETEVNLSRQSEGDERFRPNMISRAIVGSAMAVSRSVGLVVPSSARRFSASRFEQLKLRHIDEKNQPAFDLIRASVNLMVASILIAYATSLKLPLSTTYVSFMVAMGTSLSDRAWGRESAVYRVAGVLSVIGGWLMTAVIAFIAASVIALILFYTGSIGAFALFAIAIMVLFMTHSWFRRKSKEDAEADMLLNSSAKNIDEVIDSTKGETAAHLRTLTGLVVLSLGALVGDNVDVLGRNARQLKKRVEKSSKFRAKLIKFIRKMGDGHTDAGRLYITVFDLLQEFEVRSTKVVNMCHDHLKNHHSLPSREFLDDLINIKDSLQEFLDEIADSIETLNFSGAESVAEDKRALLAYLKERLDRQIHLIQTEELGNRLGSLQVELLLESESMVASAARIMKLYTRYANRVVPADSEEE